MPASAEPAASVMLQSEFSNVAAYERSSGGTRVGYVAVWAGSKNAETIECAVTTA